MFIFFDSENTSYSNENINESVENTQSLFDSIRHINEFGQEFWYARELSKVLMYHDFRNFELTMTKAMEACKNSGHEISDHFGEVTEMVSMQPRQRPSYVVKTYKGSLKRTRLTTMSVKKLEIPLNDYAELCQRICLHQTKVFSN